MRARAQLRASTIAIVAAASAAITGCDARGNGAPVAIGGSTGRVLAAHQVLHLGNGTEIQTLDPARNEDVSGSNVLRDVFEGLVNETPNGDPELRRGSVVDRQRRR